MQFDGTVFVDIFGFQYYHNYRNSTFKEVKKLSPAGRPPSKNPKSIDLKVRIEADVSKKLDAYCEAHGITRAEAIRRGIHLLLAAEQK